MAGGAGFVPRNGNGWNIPAPHVAAQPAAAAAPPAPKPAPPQRLAPGYSPFSATPQAPSYAGANFNGPSNSFLSLLPGGLGGGHAQTTPPGMGQVPGGHPQAGAPGGMGAPPLGAPPAAMPGKFTAPFAASGGK